MTDQTILMIHSGADLVEYSNHGHWIVDEPGSEVVIADIAAWLEQHDL